MEQLATYFASHGGAGLDIRVRPGLVLKRTT